MDEINNVKIELIKMLADLTKTAIKQAKENGIEAGMLNAVRENIKFLIDCLNSDHIEFIDYTFGDLEELLSPEKNKDRHKAMNAQAKLEGFGYRRWNRE